MKYEQVEEVYYITYTTSSKDWRSFVSVNGQKVIIEGFEQYDLFAYQTPKHYYLGGTWTIAEGQTGYALTYGFDHTLEDAIKEARKRLLTLDITEIENAIQKTGLSPRYRKVE